ncbi:MAG: hypothetical protein EA378_05435 [Phycisphaerales bacterium]|nr:MAG: hypothetical protein EA378_05435 [Phycisphaerales bacterium]
MSAIGTHTSDGPGPTVLGLDLLPGPILAKRATRARVMIWLRVIVAAGALLTILSLLAPDHGRVIAATTIERDEAAKELRELEQRHAALVAEQRRLEASLTAWDRAAGRLDWSGLLHAVANACTPKTALSALDLVPPERDGQFHRLTISGSEESHATVSALTLGLERIPAMRSVALRRADRVEERGEARVRFVLVCEVGMPEGAR